MTLVEGLRNLEGSDKYKALDPTKKRALQEHIFDKYVGPQMKERRADVDLAGAKTSWVNSRLGVANVEPTSKKDLALSAELSLAKGGIKTERTVLNIDDALFKGFVRFAPPSIQEAIKKTDYYKKFPERMSDAQWKLDRQEDRINSALGMNINKNLQTKVAEFPGRVGGFIEQQAPFAVVMEGTGYMGGILRGEAITEALLDGSSKAKYAYNALKGAADGYLSAKLEDRSDQEAKSTAKSFAAFEGIGGPTLAYLGRLLGIGGAQALKQSTEAVINSSKEQVEKASTEKISGALTKATAKSLNEVAQQLGFKDFWDAQAKKQGNKVVDGLMQVAGKANSEIALHNPDLVKAHAESELKELTQNPLGLKVLQIAKANGEDSVQAITQHVMDTTRALGGQVERSSVGAAAAKSLEFSDNLSAKIKTNIEFEDRSHKFLGALRMLFDEAEGKGGKMSKSDNELFNAIQNQLDQDPKYRGLGLKDRLEAGRNVLDHIDKIISKGEVDAKGIKRFWRSTEVRPSQPMGTYQRQLFARTDSIEGAPFKTGDHVRIGQTTMLGRVVEADVNHSVVELPSGAKYTVRNSEIFPAKAGKVEIAEEYARRREAATKVQAMREAEEKLAKRTAEKQRLEARKKEIEEAKAAKSKPLTDDEKLKAAFAKAGVSQDSGFLNEALKKLFPNKTFGELTSDERAQVTDLSLALKKRASR